MGQLSPDGHWQWDGWRWVPAQPVGPPRNLPPRQPTIWTRRLQILLLVVAGGGLLSGLVSAALFPSEWGAIETSIVAQWRAEGIPAAEISTLQQTLSTFLLVGIVIAVVFNLGYCALQVVGTLRRWVWWYWVQFAFCCLAAVSLVLTPLDLASPEFRAELPGLVLSLAVDVLTVGAGVCMLIAAIRIGPWAMTRTPFRAA